MGGQCSIIPERDDPELRVIMVDAAGNQQTSNYPQSSSSPSFQQSPNNVFVRAAPPPFTYQPMNYNNPWQQNGGNIGPKSYWPEPPLHQQQLQQPRFLAPFVPFNGTAANFQPFGPYDYGYSTQKQQINYAPWAAAAAPQAGYNFFSPAPGNLNNNTIGTTNVLPNLCAENVMPIIDKSTNIEQFPQQIEKLNTETGIQCKKENNTENNFQYYPSKYSTTKQQIKLSNKQQKDLTIQIKSPASSFEKNKELKGMKTVSQMVLKSRNPNNSSIEESKVLSGTDYLQPISQLTNPIFQGCEQSNSNCESSKRSNSSRTSKKKPFKSKVSKKKGNSKKQTKNSKIVAKKDSKFFSRVPSEIKENTGVYLGPTSAVTASFLQKAPHKSESGTSIKSSKQSKKTSKKAKSSTSIKSQVNSKIRKPKSSSSIKSSKSISSKKSKRKPPIPDQNSFQNSVLDYNPSERPLPLCSEKNSAWGQCTIDALKELPPKMIKNSQCSSSSSLSVKIGCENDSYLSGNAASFEIVSGYNSKIFDIHKEINKTGDLWGFQKGQSKSDDIKPTEKKNSKDSSVKTSNEKSVH